MPRRRGVQPPGPARRARVVPGAWDDLDNVAPAEFTVHTALGLLGDARSVADAMPAPQPLPAELVAEGHTIPVPRVQAMHEGKRRRRAAARAAEESSAGDLQVGRRRFGRRATRRRRRRR